MTIDLAEEKYYYYLKGRAGSFYTSLFDSIQRADTENIEKLRLGFPNEVKVIENFRNIPDYENQIIARIERTPDYGC